MSTNTTKTTGFILTLTELCLNILASLISLVILIVLAYNIYANKIKREDRIGVKLCANIYLTIFIYSCLLASSNIQSILGDIYGMNFNTLPCMVSGYLELIFIYMLFITFINQAFYRLIRIVYFQKRWFEKYWIQIILIFIELIVCCVLLSPLIIWHGVGYYNNDYFCHLLFSNILGVIWAALVLYTIPFLILLSIYLFITIYLRKQRYHLARVIIQQQNRDFIIIQRILIIICLLLLIGIPGTVLLILVLITGHEHPLTLRISFFPASVSMISLSLSLIFTIPQLKMIIQKLFRHNRIIPTVQTVQKQTATVMKANI